MEKTVALTPQLTMHTLDDALFLEYMASCKGYATTGGFESVCEAMYLQKPVLMVPTHIEQECNVIDALRSNAGVTADNFQLDKLLEFIPNLPPNIGVPLLGAYRRFHFSTTTHTNRTLRNRQ